MADYPSAAPSLPTDSTNSTTSVTVHPALHNEVNDEVNVLGAWLRTYGIGYNANPAAARVVGFGVNLWNSDTEPTNAIENDIWLQPSPA